jgi:hypothetical protein
MMTRKQKEKKVNALSDAQCREVLRDILLNCIHEGQKIQMSSSEILDEVCATLRAVGCDE